MDKFVSIIIVNWNGMRWLAGCLDSLQQQTYKNFEIVLVDNASKDGSVDFVKNNYPHVLIVRNDSNRGFAAGNNSALGAIKGDLVLLLNNDTRAPVDYLEKFVIAFDEIPNLGSAQSKIVSMNNAEMIDSCGSFWTGSTILYHYGARKSQSLEQYNKSFPVFTNVGASMMIRKSLIDKIGLFDDDFWCYYEETDFCHRVWLSGHECWYYPHAVVAHAIGGTSSSVDNGYVQFHNFKNKILSLLKIFEFWTLLTVIPAYLFINMFISFAWLMQGKLGSFTAFYKAVFWNLIHINETLNKRALIQSQRVVCDEVIFSKVKKSPRIGYYYALFFDLLHKFKDN